MSTTTRRKSRVSNLAVLKTGGPLLPPKSKAGCGTGPYCRRFYKSWTLEYNMVYDVWELMAEELHEPPCWPVCEQCGRDLAWNNKTGICYRCRRRPTSDHEIAILQKLDISV